ncbi:MAG: glycosyltransferase [Clostridiales Family XIII bacterium]|nr:glycosyltransferase [Clostridiales Family XIII bacterium]
MIKPKTIARNLFLWALTPVYRARPEAAESIIYFLKFRKRLDLKNPVTWQEKLQWIKLYYHVPLYAACSDKYLARVYMENKGHGGILNTLYWEGGDAAAIPWDSLPDRFALKVTHGCGYNLFCRDKRTFDREAAARKLNRWLHTTYLEAYGEWFYGVVPPRILCEALIDGDAPGLPPTDYKVHCFGGAPRLIQCDAGRSTPHHHRRLYEPDWTPTMINLEGRLDAGKSMPPPKRLKEMLRIAGDIAKPFPYVRVDFYETGGMLVFGEISFMNGAGFSTLAPLGTSEMLGDWIPLPEPVKGPVTREMAEEAL